MSEEFDFVIVGAGSAGAALAARLSEDPDVRVALIEAGGRPPPHEAIPAACASLQLDPATDWKFSADPGKGGRGYKNQRMPVPRGRMLGGSSGINYMAWVRGHPGDYDNWARLGAEGWSHADVLPCFRRIEDLAPSNEITINPGSHGSGGPVGVAVRSPVIPASRQFVAAAEAAGIPRGDYNGTDRGSAAGVASLMQTNTRSGRRSSTFHAYLENAAELRPNLTIITDALVTRIVFGAEMTASGAEYCDAAGALHVAHASREVVLSAGAVGSPHLLMLSGIGPRRELEAAGIACRLDQPHVGKHLKDHLQSVMHFPAPGIGVAMLEVGLALGPDALRAPAGPLPADPADDAHLGPELAGLKTEAERRFGEWLETGSGLASSSFYDAVAFYSTGLGDDYTHDAQIGFIPCGYNADIIGGCINIDIDQMLDDAEQILAPHAESVMFLASNAIPRSQGEIVIESADPARPPAIHMNYFADPHDLQVMVAIMRRVLEIAARWPGPGQLGEWRVPPKLAELHGHVPGEPPSDALLESFALHFAMTVYHLCCTCRIGSVVDPQLRVLGVKRLRVADASVMPEIISGNTNATAVMIGERAADLIAGDHAVRLAGAAG